MLQFIDVEGITKYGDHSSLLLRLRNAYPDAAVVEGHERQSLLSSLREGAGVQVVTGPTGRDFWTLASVEVQVTVWPDNYDYKERHNERIWALLASGCGLPEARALDKSHLSVGKVPTPKHKLFNVYTESLDWQASLTAHASNPLVHEDTPFEILGIDDGLAILKALTLSKTLAAVDWEWHRQYQYPVGLAISTAHDNYYVPVRGSDVDNSDRGDELQAGFRASILQGARFILHDGRADFGTQIPGDPIDLFHGEYNCHDTKVIAYLLGEPVLGLKPLSHKYLGRDPIENEYEWADMPVRFTARYAAAGDTRNTYDLFIVMMDRLNAMGRQGEIYERFERRLVPVVASMEAEGTPVDIATVKSLYRDYTAIEFGLRRAVLDLYGRDLSDDEDTRKFIVDCGFADPGTLDQRVISLNPHWCIDLILEYRKYRTRRRGFLKKHLFMNFLLEHPELLNKKLRPIKTNLKRRTEYFNMLARYKGDYRVYPRFNQAGSFDDDNKTAPRTGRMSSADPNLQNQPRDIREIYLPPKGYYWWSFDYSGLELHIAAGMSGDTKMVPASMHTDFQMYIKEKTGKDVGRPAAKTGNFEQLYEGGANQLVRIMAKLRAVLPPEDADVIVKSHHELYSGYHEWGQEMVAEARRRGYAETLDGRVRFITEYLSSDASDHSHGDRAAQNHPVQGTAADKVKEAMLLVVPVLKQYGAHMAIQVHDELDGWVPMTVDPDEFKAAMIAALETPQIPRLKLKVEGGVGASWKETH